MEEKTPWIDEAFIEVTAGRGGNGAVSFRREKFVPWGGPDGGDGGKGGSVIIKADSSLSTLLDYRYRRIWKATSGSHGGGSNRHGKKGEDLYIPVPVGTVIKDEQGEVWADLKEDRQQQVIAEGGRGGKGNRKFATSKNRAPGFAEYGEPGETRKIYLELKLLADVGIVGLPNAGKSTLLSHLSAANPKVASYPFTTLNPKLGVLKYRDEQIVAADLPGIIEGASQGAGLGYRFLRHTERTSLLLMLIDVSSWAEEDPVEAITKIDREISFFSSRLEKKPRLVVGNKIDLEGAEEGLKQLQRALIKDERVVAPVLGISAVSGEGLEELLAQLSFLVKEYKEEGVFTEEEELVEEPSQGNVRRFEKGDLTVEAREEYYVVKGSGIESLVARTDFENQEAVHRFWRAYQKMGLEAKLIEKGVQPGDTVLIGEQEFTFYPGDYYPDSSTGMDANNFSGNEE